MEETPNNKEFFERPERQNRRRKRLQRVLDQNHSKYIIDESGGDSWIFKQMDEQKPSMQNNSRQTTEYVYDEKSPNELARGQKCVASASNDGGYDRDVSRSCSNSPTHSSFSIAQYEAHMKSNSSTEMPVSPDADSTSKYNSQNKLGLKSYWEQNFDESNGKEVHQSDAFQPQFHSNEYAKKFHVSFDLAKNNFTADEDHEEKPTDTFQSKQKPERHVNSEGSGSSRNIRIRVPQQIAVNKQFAPLTVFSTPSPRTNKVLANSFGRFNNGCGNSTRLLPVTSQEPSTSNKNPFTSLIDRFTLRRHKSENQIMNNLDLKSKRTSLVCQCNETPTSAKNYGVPEIMFSPVQRNPRRSFKWRSIFAIPQKSANLPGSNQGIKFPPITRDIDEYNRASIREQQPNLQLTREKGVNISVLKKNGSFSSTNGGNAIVQMETVFETCEGVNENEQPEKEPISEANAQVKLREPKCGATESNFLNTPTFLLPRPFSEIIGSGGNTELNECGKLSRRIQMKLKYCICDDDSKKLDALLLKNPEMNVKTEYFYADDADLSYLNLIKPSYFGFENTKAQDPFDTGTEAGAAVSTQSPNTMVEFASNQVFDAISNNSKTRHRRRRQRDSIVGRSTVAVTASTLRRRKALQHRINTTITTSGNGTLNRRRSSINSTLLMSKRMVDATDSSEQQKIVLEVGNKNYGQPNQVSSRKTKAYSTSSLRQILNKNEDIRNPANSNKSRLGTVGSEKRAEKEGRKRDTKTNSVILGSWLRQRRKKEGNNGNRSLANLFTVRNQSETGSHCGQSEISGSTTNCSTTLPQKSDDLNGALNQSANSKRFTSAEKKSDSPSLELGNRKTSIDDCEFSGLLRPDMIKGDWDDLELWSQSPVPWLKLVIDQNQHDNYIEYDRLRYEAFSELVETEYNHCHVLVFFRHWYIQGLIQFGLITGEDQIVSHEVLDDLIKFHTTLLRKFRHASLNHLVDRITNDMIDEFENGVNREKAIDAYTAFCLSHKKSLDYYSHSISQNERFRRFFEYSEKIAENKRFDYKSCLLLIAQRLTKYPIILQTINKYCTDKYQREFSERALIAVRRFANQVNNKKLETELTSHLNAIKFLVSKDSKGSFLDQGFTIDDMLEPVNQGFNGSFRKIALITTVHYQRVMGQKVELRLLLFNDIIVFLLVKNETASSPKLEKNDSMRINSMEKCKSMQFFCLDNHASVVPLHATLIREMPRTNEIMLVIVSRARSDMFRIMFDNKSELENFIRAINFARERVPNFVMLANGCRREANGRLHKSEESESIQKEANLLEGDGVPESDYEKKFAKWIEGLNGLFDEQIKREDELVNYFHARMQFNDALRTHIEYLPLQPLALPPAVGNETPSVINAYARELKTIEKLKKSWRDSLSEIKRYRYRAFNSLIEKAMSMRDLDLPPIFDDLSDLYCDPLISPVGTSVSSDGDFSIIPCCTSTEGDASSNETGNGSPTLDKQCAEDFVTKPTDSTSLPENAQEHRMKLHKKTLKKPRRTRTYHGLVNTNPMFKQENGQSSIRRHTTVPPPATIITDDSSDANDEEGPVSERNGQEEFKRRIRKFPPKIGPKTHKAITDLIYEMIELRAENNKLKAQATLRDLYITSLQTKKAPVVETAEKIESLRQKLAELSIREREFKSEVELKMDLLRRKEENLKNEQSVVDKKNEELNKKKEELRLTGALHHSSTISSNETLQSFDYIADTSTTDSQILTTTSSLPTQSSFSEVEKSTENQIFGERNSHNDVINDPNMSNNSKAIGRNHLGCTSSTFPIANSPNRTCSKNQSQAELPRHLVVKTEQAKRKKR